MYYRLQILYVQFKENTDLSLVVYLICFLVTLAVSIIGWNVCNCLKRHKRIRKIEQYIDKELELNRQYIENFVEIVKPMTKSSTDAKLEIDWADIKFESNCIGIDGWNRYETEVSEYLLSLKEKKKDKSVKNEEIWSSDEANSELGKKGNTKIVDSPDITKGLKVAGNLKVFGSRIITGGLKVPGDIIIMGNGSLKIDGDLKVSGKLKSSGILEINGKLDVAGKRDKGLQTKYHTWTRMYRLLGRIQEISKNPPADKEQEQIKNELNKLCNLYLDLI